MHEYDFDVEYYSKEKKFEVCNVEACTFLVFCSVFVGNSVDPHSKHINSSPVSVAL